VVGRYVGMSKRGGNVDSGRRIEFQKVREEVERCAQGSERKERSIGKGSYRQGQLKEAGRIIQFLSKGAVSGCIHRPI